MIKKVVLSFPVDATDRSLTYDLVKIYDIRINILKAEIQAGKSGNLLVELEADEERMQQGIAYLEECGVTVSPVSSKVSYDESLCIDCGNCVSACFSKMLRTMRSPQISAAEKSASSAWSVSDSPMAGHP